ncbi:MAG: HPr family phosphocarrier protein [Pirellulales bacterium]
MAVVNRQGLHARPAHLFVKLANQFESKIEVVKDSQRADGKSILSVIALCAEVGSQLMIEATGQDANDALDALGQLVEQGFAAEENGD